MKKVSKIRIGNIEIRPTKSLLDKEYYDIIKWEPNSHYNMENEYPVVDGDYRMKSEGSNCRVHKSCFKNRETCYSIASFEEDKEGYLNLNSVGSRLWDISKDEWNELYDMLRWFNDRYNAAKVTEDNDCD